MRRIILSIILLLAALPIFGKPGDRNISAEDGEGEYVEGEADVSAEKKYPDGEGEYVVEGEVDVNDEEKYVEEDDEDVNGKEEYLGDILFDEWSAAFSADGRRQWKPEITARVRAGIYTGGEALSVGARIDGKRTLGLIAGRGHFFVDAAPGEVNRIQAAAFMRRYFHIGKHDVIAFYSDLSAGAAWVYEVNGKYMIDSQTGEKVELIPQNPGDVHFMVTWEPGIRLRFFKNIHIFLGPTISTDCMGLHLGLGI